MTRSRSTGCLLAGKGKWLFPLIAFLFLLVTLASLLSAWRWHPPSPDEVDRTVVSKIEEIGGRVDYVYLPEDDSTCWFERQLGIKRKPGLWMVVASVPAKNAAVPDYEGSILRLLVKLSRVDSVVVYGTFLEMVQEGRGHNQGRSSAKKATSRVRKRPLLSRGVEVEVRAGGGWSCES